VFNLADFPTSWKTCMTASTGKQYQFLLKTCDDICIADTAISGVWWRRTRPFEISSDVTDKGHREFCAAETRALFEAWIYSLGRRVINPFAAELAARRKPYQLIMATRAGLKIPQSLVTNDQDILRGFIEQNDMQLVYKALTSVPWRVIETRRLDEEAMKNLHMLDVAPVIFQEEIVGGPDIRVTVVDEEIFAAELVPTHPEAQVDWRLDPAIEPRDHILPEAISQNILTLQRSLGLRYGAYDFRINTHGEYIFFEVNPSGQYLFVEINTGNKISRAIGQALVKGKSENCVL
jgi:glutathione synthase/RimK-type ligase-like ATP-grasp enzyme